MTRLRAVTPAQAAAWLGTSDQPVKPHRLEPLVRKIRAGRWRVGDPSERPVCIDRRGRLFNGHHRLRAIVESGQTVTLLVREDSRVTPDH